MPTTAGSLSLKGSIPPRDAFMVRKLREAGAIVLAKSNLAEFARSPYETVNSLLPGHTRNPYALDRVPAGSSGGTAAAVAASFGAAGLGTDTGNSIRGPASHTSLVGIRPTLGLTSRDGIVPLFLSRDTGGPLARTVADAAAVLDAVAGTDPADAATAAAQGRRPASYLSALDKDGLKGARIGVLRQFLAGGDPDPEFVALFEQALADMKRRGAEIVEGHRRSRYSDLSARLRSLQARHQRLSGASRTAGAGEEPRRDHRVAKILSAAGEIAARLRGPAAARSEPEMPSRRGERAPSRRGRAQGHGRRTARRAGVSHLEQPAAG